MVAILAAVYSMYGVNKDVGETGGKFWKETVDARLIFFLITGR